ncbi:uncharacterized protein LOC128317069 isoform X2 [Pangasianodon hypophthalmus]|uniref:uncharacterized protein LOC128317069 isoform X2 n=1 Tax=Pangasianodon hypophthalmus TaxID=310915 RepID=UPI002307903D|nr:uncharacterized protein LOC128317069 isoform X2 [Pangasianodon hypophthalmus]
MGSSSSSSSKKGTNNSGVHKGKKRKRGSKEISTHSSRQYQGIMTSVFSICIVLGTMCVSLLSAEAEITVSGQVGSTPVLPCELQSVGTETPYIWWITESKTVFERLGEESYQGEGYEGRVDVPEEELRKGNCSLVLRNLTLTDAGVYTSYQIVRRTKRSASVIPKTDEISRVNLSVQVSPLKETNRNISPAPTGDAGMKIPHPLIMVLTLISRLLLQLVYEET